jgi:RimJ/RimL family protein N-acetyltransferase
MDTATVGTRRLWLVPRSPEAALAQVEQMPSDQRAEVSPVWLARVKSGNADVWTLGFSMVDRATGHAVGSCGFKDAPDADGMVEIAYGVAAERQNQGLATEAAEALVEFAFGTGRVRVVRAHTSESANNSARVLVKCGFVARGRVVEPEDGLVWRWEKPAGNIT